MLRILSIAVLLVGVATGLYAQEEQSSLGDVAREARKAKTPEGSSGGQRVIDNDNFASVLDEAEAAHLTGKPVFSIDPSGNAFRMTSPDGTCSLSFDAKATSLITSSFVSTDLPPYELPKVEGHATIHDGVIEVAVHNSSGWELREVVIGVTVLQRVVKPDVGLDLSETSMVSEPTWTGKSPDSTAIYHLRGSAAANSTATFTAVLGQDSTIPFGENTDWHWALVSARGLPPASAPSLQTAVLPSTTSNAVSAESVSGVPAAVASPPSGNVSSVPTQVR
jgi:hypothetical protein